MASLVKLKTGAYRITITRGDWKPATLAAFRTATKKMMAFFGKDTPLSSVAAEQCHKYKAELLRKHSQGYTSKQIERGKNLFTAAVHRKLLTENPFASVIAGPRPFPRLHRTPSKAMALYPQTMKGFYHDKVQ